MHQYRPVFLFLELPREEWDGGTLLYMMLPSFLDAQVRDLETGLEIFKTGYSKRDVSWEVAGLRSGAIAIANFLEIKRTIRTRILPQVPSLQDLVNHDLLDQADALFDVRFPSATAFRTAIAHPGRIFRDKENLMKNSFSGMVLGFSYVNGYAQVILENEVHRYKASVETVQELGEIRDLIAEAFRPASEYTLRLREERIKRGEPQPTP